MEKETHITASKFHYFLFGKVGMKQLIIIY